MRDMSELDSGNSGDGIDVLVAASGQVDQQDLVLRHGRRDLRGVGQRVAGFQGRDDAFVTAQVMEGGQGFVVVDG
jgi:hypothetical protein